MDSNDWYTDFNSAFDRGYSWGFSEIRPVKWEDVEPEEPWNENYMKAWNEGRNHGLEEV